MVCLRWVCFMIGRRNSIPLKVVVVRQPLPAWKQVTIIVIIVIILISITIIIMIQVIVIVIISITIIIIIIIVTIVRIVAK